MDLRTGYRIYEDLRERPHLKLVPIIILTNFYEPEHAVAIESKDERAVILGKDTLPSELVIEVKRRIETYPVTREDTVIPLTEHPNVAPYYVFDAKSGERRRVYFDYYRDSDPKVFDNKISAPWYWRFGDAWLHYTESEQTRNHLLKAVLHDAPPEAETIHGIYYMGGTSPQNWYRDVLFESAPWSRQEAGELRQLRGIGKAMVARFIRQCLRHYGHYEPLLISGETQLQPEETGIGISDKAKDFFVALGFSTDPRSEDVLRLEHDAALAILNDVSGRTIDNPPEEKGSE
jgi:hypothetical protein